MNKAIVYYKVVGLEDINGVCVVNKAIVVTSHIRQEYEL